MSEKLANGKVVLGRGDINLGRPKKARKRVWAKVLTEPVDTEKSNGFAFKGRWLRVRGDPAFIDDMVEPPAYIVATAGDGSTNHPRTGIRLYKVDEEGNVELLFAGYFDEKAESVNAIKTIADMVNEELTPLSQPKEAPEARPRTEKPEPPAGTGWTFIAKGIPTGVNEESIAKVLLDFMSEIKAREIQNDFLKDIAEKRVYYDMGTIQVHESARTIDVFLEVVASHGMVPAIPISPRDEKGDRQ